MLTLGKIQNNVQLQAFNTFAVQATAKGLLAFDSITQLEVHQAAIKSFKQKMVLGGGSNVLFIDSFDGLILYPQLFGIDIIEETDDQIVVAVGASENWHDFVLQCESRGWYGLENLALIPGNVGGSPVQNIGAYGVEVKSFIDWVEVYDFDQQVITTLNNQQCQFSYRDSVFKQAPMGQFCITRVAFRLSKVFQPCISYEPLKSIYSQQEQVTAKQIIQTVCQVRQQKLPDPAKLPNGGSFFKNPVVSASHYSRLKQEYPDLVAYPQGDEFKLAAGWLIEKAGFKGCTRNQVGVHKHQALVLVNYGDTQGLSIWRLAQEIQQTVQDMFEIDLEVEVRVIGNASR